MLCSLKINFFLQQHIYKTNLQVTSMKISSFDEYKKTYEFSIKNPVQFWQNIASENVWIKKWDKVLEYDFNTFSHKWFLNGKLNITQNCLDEQVKKNPTKIAYHFEGNEPNNSQTITYEKLYSLVCQFANVLKKNNLKKGDRVCIYMPLIPEAIIAILACARIGVVHNVVFGGFSAIALKERILDSECKLIITTTQAKRGTKDIDMKNIVDNAIENVSCVQKVIVFENYPLQINMKLGRDVWWHDEIKTVSNICQYETMDSEDPLFILYTSGSTGKPKGILHTCGGYMVYAKYSFENVFQYEKNDIYWCSADIGWITGHTYVVYGPLLTGATSVIYEGIPTYPTPSRFWEIIDKYKVSIFYTAPTTLRSLKALGNEPVVSTSRKSLRILGSVGEPINEEAWHWYFEIVGNNNCSIVDTWWQTETGGILISPLANITPTKPSFATLPLPGIQAIILDHSGKEITQPNIEGNLCIKFPWPALLRTTWGDHARCQRTYFDAFKGHYFTGDGAYKDELGNYRIIGRVDDVLNISAHRIGTAEIENVINSHHSVSESAVVGYPHDIKGESIYAFVICTKNCSESVLLDEINLELRKQIGPIAKIEKLQIVPDLPKTRSGKIMRRILRSIAYNKEDFGDTSTLLNPVIVQDIFKNRKN